MIIYSIPNHLECQLVSSYKMIKMCLSFLIIFILISFRVEAKSSCNDECLTKTYCISSDDSGVCSKNNLVTAQFKVIPVFGNYDFIQLTLKGYNVTSNDEKTIKVSFDKSGSPSNVYTCYKSSNRSTTAMFDRGTFSSTTGSSHYMEGVLSCTWTFNIYYTIWPLDVDLIKYSSQSITLYHDSKKVVVAQGTSQLPIYHVQYLKCCNQVHANDVFLLTFDQTEKQIRYRLYYWKYDSNKKVTVTLTRKDGVKLQFECNLYSDLDGYISNGTERFSVDQQLIERSVDYHRICSWATPFVLGNSGISIDASTSVFDLQVEDDRGPVYIEQDVALKNSSHLLKLNLIFIAFAILNSIDLLIN